MSNIKLEKKTIHGTECKKSVLTHTSLCTRTKMLETRQANVVVLEIPSGAEVALVHNYDRSLAL